jgi:protease I
VDGPASNWSRELSRPRPDGVAAADPTRKENSFMDQPLAGKVVAILVANGFEELEMTEPQRALLKAGATLKIVSPEQGLVNGWHGQAWGHYFPVDCSVNDVLAADFDMLLVPGGERSTAKLKQSAHCRRIVGNFMDADKPIAAVDHAVELLAAFEKLRDRKVTASLSLQEGVEQAGGQWTGEPVTVDNHLVTAQGAAALPLFVERVVKVFTEASQIRQAA